ncbi:alpha/beta hydrolase [Actinomadura barringtoniae]|uniref:Alpha/beta hydrolase n=1 Tax=Actinomadura barringtoniae TaxID=1427535 RepID=A0A939T750_9ACTN|nr:alpha/beta hydrolase [Actinomadura barringtoniae]MBO2445525.1 alpha/beta hydrolase [Actinomadura barringtoniae]
MPPLGRLYEVGDRRLMLYRTGSGGPAVVFLPGAGLVGLDYINTHDRVAEVTTSVIYDRAGTGWSDRAPLPRTGAAVAAELSDVLRVAEVPGPYVLVGHSLGGVYARLFAARFPNDVAGLLLLDPFHEDLTADAPQEVLDKLEQMKRPEDLPDLTAEQLQQARVTLDKHFAAWPDDVRGPLVDYRLASWRNAMLEDNNLYDEVSDELRNAPALPDVPLIVITAAGHDATQAALWSEEIVRKTHETKLDLHARLAASVPRGEHRVLDDAGHGYPHEERRDAVLHAIDDLLTAAR